MHGERKRERRREGEDPGCTATWREGEREEGEKGEEERRYSRDDF